MGRLSSGASMLLTISVPGFGIPGQSSFYAVDSHRECLHSRRTFHQCTSSTSPTRFHFIGAHIGGQRRSTEFSSRTQTNGCSSSLCTSMVLPHSWREIFRRSTVYKRPKLVARSLSWARSLRKPPPLMVQRLPSGHFSDRPRLNLEPQFSRQATLEMWSLSSSDTGCDVRNR